MKGQEEKSENSFRLDEDTFYEIEYILEEQWEDARGRAYDGLVSLLEKTNLILRLPDRNKECKARAKKLIPKITAALNSINQTFPGHKNDQK